MFKTIFTVTLLTLFGISFNAVAEIDPGASSASHHLEEASAEAHEYLHDNYAMGLGSHQLEEAAEEIHHALHEGHSEAEVAELAEELKSTWNSFKMQMQSSGLLHAGDMTLDDHFNEVKAHYKELRFLLRKLES